MKILKAIVAIAILLGGPLLGTILVVLIGSFLWMPDDPNFIANGGHGSPGDGFLSIGLIFVGGIVVLYKPKTQDQIST